MYDLLVLYTFVTLVVFFVALEIYKFKFYLRGEILEFYNSDLGLDAMIVSHVKVKLRNGQIVKAEAERCTMCMGQFSVGDDVRLIKSRDKYLIHLSLISTKNKSCKTH